jgi:hypothetical protein
MAREKKLSRRAEDRLGGETVSHGDRYAVEAADARKAARDAGITQVVDHGTGDGRVRRGNNRHERIALAMGVDIISGSIPVSAPQEIGNAEPQPAVPASENGRRTSERRRSAPAKVVPSAARDRMVGSSGSTDAAGVDVAAVAKRIRPYRDAEADTAGARGRNRRRRRRGNADEE